MKGKKDWRRELERKFGKYAIPNLMTYIIILYIVGFIIDLVAPGFYSSYLSLDIGRILHKGEIWRLITFIIQPPQASIFFIIFALLLYYTIGRQLEYVWGAFWFNVYFFMGVLLHVVAGFLAYFIFRISLPLGTYYLNLSLFFAYAAMYPEQRFYLFMIIPVKLKWLACFDGAFFAYTILQAFLPAYGGSVAGIYYKAQALEAAVSLINFLAFYIAMKNVRRFAPKEIKRKMEFKKQVQQGKKEQNPGPGGARHRCAVCGRTELDDERLEFRYCSKCNGNYEYCQDHLFTHEHIK